MASSEKEINKFDKKITSKADNNRLAKARACIAKNTYQKAIGLLNELIDNNPDLAEACYLLGICYINETRYLDATIVLSKAIEIEPSIAEYYSMAALAHTNIGSVNLAYKNYKQALELDDENIAALVGLGNYYSDRNDYVSACELYSKAVKIKPSMLDLQIKLAFALSNIGEYKQALNHVEKCLRQNPTDSNVIGTIGRIHLVGGNIEEAKKYFRKATDLDRTNGVAYYELVSNTKIRDKNDPIISQMEKVLKTSLPVRNRQIMHFALGQAYNDSKQWDRAFDNFNKGNRLISTTYKQKSRAALIRNTKKIFTSSFFNKYKHIGNQSTSPVFIIGMPRSGSTLIDQVLSSHSQVFSIGESMAISNVLSDIAKNSNAQSYEQNIKTITSDIITSASNQYLEITMKDSGDAKCVVDKMLSNYLYLGLIAILFPNAKVIHSTRNPLDSCLSCFFTAFEPLGAEDEWRSSLENIGATYRNYSELMTYWKKVLPITILDIRYEDMVANLEDNARNIINYCGLEWEPNCLEFYKAKRSVQTASVSQVRQPIYQSSISRWPPYAKYLDPLVEQLGGIIKDDYEQLKALGCEVKINKQGLFKKLF